jgi:hypothetical protein
LTWGISRWHIGFNRSSGVVETIVALSESLLDRLVRTYNTRGENFSNVIFDLLKLGLVVSVSIRNTTVVQQSQQPRDNCVGRSENSDGCVVEPSRAESCDTSTNHQLQDKKNCANEADEVK